MLPQAIAMANNEIKGPTLKKEKKKKNQNKNMEGQIGVQRQHEAN